jgi:hypothetical protein
MKLSNEKSNPILDFGMLTHMAILLKSKSASPKTTNSENKSAKQRQTASERPEQTHRTKRLSKNTKEISLIR